MTVIHFSVPCDPCWWNPTGQPFKYTRWSFKSAETPVTPMRYAEVEKAEAEFAEAKRKLDEVKNAYAGVARVASGGRPRRGDDRVVDER